MVNPDPLDASLSAATREEVDQLLQYSRNIEIQDEIAAVALLEPGDRYETKPHSKPFLRSELVALALLVTPLEDRTALPLPEYDTATLREYICKRAGVEDPNYTRDNVGLIREHLKAIYRAIRALPKEWPPWFMHTGHADPGEEAQTATEVV